MQAKRAKLSYHRETIDSQQDIRVFDDVPGVLRFEHYEDSGARHKKDIGDKKLKLSSTQVADHFRAVAGQVVDKKTHAKALTAKDLDKASGGDGNRELSRKPSTESESSGSTDSNGSADSEAPLVAAVAKPDKPDKPKGKAKPDKPVAASAMVQVNDEMQDVPQNKKDESFHRQTQHKLVAAQQVLQIIVEAPSSKEIDESRVVSAIRFLDGRLLNI